MKKLIVLSFIVLLGCTVAPPVTPTLPHEPMCDYLFNSWEQAKALGNEGLYFRIGEKEALIFVMDSEVGLHELCHFIDMERDYTSQTQAFKDAVYEFLTAPSDLQETFDFWLEIGLGMDDVYAELCKISLTGELPPIFEEFFD